ncbi:MAG: hypothetical protein HUU02_03395 [Bacteroidetes bacterium]|nr:hypothetical protein [Bacteroidota bacterium]
MNRIVRSLSDAFRDPADRAASILILLFIVTAAFSVTQTSSYTPDSARYEIWARSIAAGEGFVDTTDPEAPRYVVHAPLYPVLIAPFAWLLPLTPYALKFGTLIITAVMLLLFHRFVKGKVSAVPAGIALALLAFHPFTLHYSTQLLSEPLFLLLLIVLFSLMSRVGNEGAADTATMVWLTVVLAASVLTREIGIVLVPVVLLFLVLHRKYDMAGWTFVGIVLVFGAWYVRNEIIVAGREQPDLRNSLLFGSNILTSGRTAFLQEIVARITVNAAFYLRELPGLFHYPQFGLDGEVRPTFYSVVDRSSLMITAAQRIVAPRFIIAAVLAAGSVVTGMIREFRNGRLAPIYSLFIIFYSVMVLLYPVADIRFTYPLLLILLILAAQGVDAFMTGRNILMKRIVIAAALFLMLPNLLWTAEMIGRASAYRSASTSTEQFDRSSASVPTEFATSFPLAAEWFIKRGLQPDVIIAKRKEFGIVLPGTKVLLMNEFSGLSAFEQMIRDYDVRYIVSSRDRAGVREFDLLMGLSRTYSFEQQGSAGGFDIFAVRQAESGRPALRSAGAVQTLAHLVDNGDFRQLERFFRAEQRLAEVHPLFRYYHAVTLECLGSLDSARLLFATLQGMPQGIGYAQKAGFHATMLDQLTALQRTSDSAQRADILFNLAVNYWELDMRTTALRFLNAAVMQQRSYIPAYNLFIHFSLQIGDTVNARGAFTVLQRSFPGEPSIAPFGELFSLIDEGRQARTAEQQAGIQERMAAAYERLGLSDARIASLRRAVMLQPDRESAVLVLSSLYRERRRTYPALKILTLAQQYLPGSPHISDAIREITGR